MTSLALEQSLISLPSQQVSSSSTALSTQAEPSQTVITDATWEEYQQAQTHQRGKASAASTISAHSTFSRLQNTWSLLLLSVCEEQQHHLPLQRI